MNMLPLTDILIYGLLMSIVTGVLILGSLYINPRIWLQDYPAEIRAKVPPNTPDEKRAQLYEQVHERYKELYPALRLSFRALANFE